MPTVYRYNPNIPEPRRPSAQKNPNAPPRKQRPLEKARYPSQRGMNAAMLRKQMAARRQELLDNSNLSFHELVALEKAKGLSAFAAVRKVAALYPEKHQAVIAAGARVRR